MYGDFGRVFESSVISGLVRSSNLVSEGGLEFFGFFFSTMDIYTALICRFVGWLILDESSARDRSITATGDCASLWWIFFLFAFFKLGPASSPFSVLLLSSL